LLLTLSSLIATSSLVEMLVPAQPAATGHVGAVTSWPFHSTASAVFLWRRTESPTSSACPPQKHAHTPSHMLAQGRLRISPDHAPRHPEQLCAIPASVIIACSVQPRAGTEGGRERTKENVAERTAADFATEPVFVPYAELHLPRTWAPHRRPSSSCTQLSFPVVRSSPRGVSSRGRALQPPRTAASADWSCSQLVRDRQAS